MISTLGKAPGVDGIKTMGVPETGGKGIAMPGPDGGKTGGGSVRVEAQDDKMTAKLPMARLWTIR